MVGAWADRQTGFHCKVSEKGHREATRNKRKRTRETLSAAHTLGVHSAHPSVRIIVSSGVLSAVWLK